jgi:cell division protein FtsB
MEIGERDILDDAVERTFNINKRFIGIWIKIFLFAMILYFGMNDMVLGIGIVLFIAILMIEAVGTSMMDFLNGIQLSNVFRQQKEKHNTELDRKFQEMQDKIDFLSERVSKLEGEYRL